SLFICLVSTIAFSQSQLPDNFDEWIENGRKDWQIPGLAVGIVKDGKVVYAKGFGEKQLGSKDLVDANTVFSIASVSKNITAAASGSLVDEGFISLGDIITDHLCWVPFKDS